MPIGYTRKQYIAREYDIICRLRCLENYHKLGQKSILRSEHVVETDIPDYFG